MKKLFILVFFLLPLLSYGQTPLKIGDKNNYTYNPGILACDSIDATWSGLDSATVKAAFPLKRMKGRTGFQGNRPFVLDTAGNAFLLAAYKEVSGKVDSIKRGINTDSLYYAVGGVFHFVGVANPFTANVMDYGAIGDGATNNRAAFLAAIASGKKVIDVPDGHFLINGTSDVYEIILNTGQTIRGTGRGSVLMTTDDKEILRVNDSSRAINLSFKGTGKFDMTKTSQSGLGTATHNGGILLQGLYFTGFRANGISAVGYQTLGTGKTYQNNMSDIVIDACGTGAKFTNRSEFWLINNFRSHFCTRGYEDNSGNNKITNFDITENDTNYVVRSGDNNGHGIASCGTLVHANNCAVYIDSTMQGYVFNAVSIYNKPVIIKKSQDILFTGCILAVPVRSYDSRHIFIDGCIRRDLYEPDSAFGGQRPSKLGYNNGGISLNDSGIFVDSNKFVGVGTTVPASEIHVKGDKNSLLGLTIENLNSGSGAASYMEFKNNAGGIGLISAGSSNYGFTNLANSFNIISESLAARTNIIMNNLGNFYLQEGFGGTGRYFTVIGNGQGRTIISGGSPTDNLVDRLQVEGSAHIETIPTVTSTTEVLVPSSGQVNKITTSNLATSITDSFIPNNTTTTPDTRSYNITGYAGVQVSNPNNTLSSVRNGNVTINTAFSTMGTVTNSGSSTTNNVNTALYAALNFSSVSNMTSPSGFGNYGALIDIDLTGTTFASTTMVPSAIAGRLRFSNTTATTMAVFTAYANYANTNSNTTSIQYYAPAYTGAGTKPTNWFPFLQEGTIGINSYDAPSRFGNYYCFSSTPAIVAGAGAGTTPTISISGTNARVKITLTPGTTPSANAVIATVTLAGSFAYPTECKPIFSAGNKLATTLSGSTQIFCVGSTNSFTLNSNDVALSAGEYIWYVTPGN